MFAFAAITKSGLRGPICGLKLKAPTKTTPASQLQSDMPKIDPPLAATIKLMHQQPDAIDLQIMHCEAPAHLAHGYRPKRKADGTMGILPYRLYTFKGTTVSRKRIKAT